VQSPLAFRGLFCAPLWGAGLSGRSGG
jgi:hypothetical protein